MKDVLKWVVFGGIFMLPFLPLVVTDTLFFPYITGKNFGFRIIVEVIFAAWVLLALYEPAYRPKRSYILYALAAFVAIIGIADIFGATPEKSFWSNFERMEGWVTLAHLLLYVVVAGSVLTTQKLWTYFWWTSLAAASIVSMYAFAQLAGEVQINQGGVRIDATLGNAIYMAVYMLFHAFIALFMLVRAQYTWQRALYGFLGLVFVFLLVQTATRGTLLGLLAGLFVTTVYLALFERVNVLVRKTAIGALIALGVLVGGFYAVKETAYVQGHPVFSRIASISLEAGETRFTIWGMALEGALERPILGWGQGNFNYVFSEYYEPSLYAQEPWFDRVHNIILDWFVAGGILGLASYLALYAAALWTLLRTREADPMPFSVAERSVLLGLLAGYAVHNVFVFDNLISYLFFGSVLAFIHARTARPWQRVEAYAVHAQTITYYAAPAVAVVLLVSLYLVNVPNIRAAHDLLGAIRAVDTAQGAQGLTAAQRNQLLVHGLSEFQTALAHNSFADEEIRQRLAIAAQSVLQSDTVPTDIKEAYAVLTARELDEQLQERPNDAQVRVFAGSYYRTIGDLDRALAEFETARTLSPKKQNILFNLGLTHLARDEHDQALDVFKTAFELAPSYDRARELYIVAAIHAGEDALVEELSASPHDTLYRESEAILQAYYSTKRYAAALEIIDARIAERPDDPSLYTMKAQVQYDAGDMAAVRTTIDAAIEQFPQYEAQLRSFFESLQE